MYSYLLIPITYKFNFDKVYMHVNGVNTYNYTYNYINTHKDTMNNTCSGSNLSVVDCPAFTEFLTSSLEKTIYLNENELFLQPGEK